ncbi:hypothetical protein [Lysobacter gummosus]
MAKNSALHRIKNCENYRYVCVFSAKILPCKSLSSARYECAWCHARRR